MSSSRNRGRFRDQGRGQTQADEGEEGEEGQEPSAEAESEADAPNDGAQETADQRRARRLPPPRSHPAKQEMFAKASQLVVRLARQHYGLNFRLREGDDAAYVSLGELIDNLVGVEGLSAGAAGSAAVPVPGQARPPRTGPKAGRDDFDYDALGEQLIQMLKREPTLTGKQMGERLKTPSHRVMRTLKRLVDAGRVAKIGHSTHTRWVVQR